MVNWPTELAHTAHSPTLSRHSPLPRSTSTHLRLLVLAVDVHRVAARFELRLVALQRRLALALGGGGACACVEEVWSNTASCTVRRAP
jgi:hypothetical protein